MRVFNPLILVILNFKCNSILLWIYNFNIIIQSRNKVRKVTIPPIVLIIKIFLTDRRELDQINLDLTWWPGFFSWRNKYFQTSGNMEHQGNVDYVRYVPVIICHISTTQILSSYILELVCIYHASSERIWIRVFHSFILISINLNQY